MSTEINGNYDSKSYLTGTPVSDNDSVEKYRVGPNKGLTVKACAMFIVAEIAGSGVLALAQAIAQCDWTGIGLLVFACLLALYCGILLGNCLTLVQNENPNLTGHIRDPYPLIGFQAYGKAGKYIVHICIFMTLFGTCVVYLLLASEQISALIGDKIGDFSIESEFRIWILICAAVLLPFTWLSTPKEMWPFAILATACTVLTSMLIVIRCSMEIYKHGVRSKHDEVTATSFFTAFGTISFAYGGAAILPSFQIDMREPKNFPQAATIGYIGCLALYLPAALIPYLALGNSVESNVLKTLTALEGSGKLLVTLSLIFITLHLLFAFVIVLNPVAQHVEEYFQISHSFGWRRIVIRTSIVLLIIAVAEAIPNFSTILSLIGGSTITMLSFVLPPLFYLKLKKSVSLHIKILLGEIILLALTFGIAATYSAANGFKNPFKRL